MTMRPHILIYTDGACLGNPGPGGWAALMVSGTHEKELSGFVAETTNNRMELMAAIKALEALKKPSRVDLFTDSEYLRRGVSEWLRAWKARGWKTADRKPVKNVDLWEAIDPLLGRHDVTLHWVRGHNGHPENERVDSLARAAAQRESASLTTPRT